MALFSGVRVFLIHGMGRSPASMFLLGRRLRNAGFATNYFGYFVTARSLEQIVARFVEHVARTQRASEPYAIVGHSLGGIIARLAAPALPDGLCRLVMLAPPNRPPALARSLARQPVYRMLTRDAGQRLASPEFFASIPRVTVPTLVLAGNAVRGLPLHPHRHEPGDGVVSVAETRLDGATHEIVPAIHTFIMNDPLVARRVCSFLHHSAS